MNLDLCTTNVCNFGCKYCSEGHYSFDLIKERNLKGKTTVTPKEVRRILESSSDIHHVLAFWGGEPLLNFDFCKEIMEEFAHDNVSFLFYANGYYIKKYIKELKAFSDYLGDLPKYIVQNLPQRRLFVQISYDGNPINDKMRVLKNGEGTSNIIKDAVKLLRENNIDYSIKSVITPENFKHMFSAFLDVISLGSSYYPTPDLYIKEVSEENLKDLKMNLALIAKYILDNNLPPSIFGWFQDSKAKCTAGINYFAVNTNKDMMICHGAMYGTDHFITRIDDIRATDLLKKKTSETQKSLSSAYKRCDTCHVRFCMKCQFANYNMHPEIKDYQERWYSLNDNLCKVFEINNKVYCSLLKIQRK